MSTLRHNAATLALVLIVGAVTALNSYTLQMEKACDSGSAKLVDTVQYQMNVIHHQGNHLRTMFRDLAATHKANNEISSELSKAAEHIHECHALLQQAGITPPASPLRVGPPKASE